MSTQSGLFTMTELAAQYGISRKTGYKWLEPVRSRRARAGLRDRSRRPHTVRRRRILSWWRRCWRSAGGIRAGGRRSCWRSRRGSDAARGLAEPIDGVLRGSRQRGLVAPRRRRRRAAPAPRAAAGADHARRTRCGRRISKGEFRTGDGVYCYPLTLRDGFSRFVLRCDALLGRTYEATRRRFERAFADYGLPERIRSDNGGALCESGAGRVVARCRCGGSAWGSSRNASRRGIPNKTGRTSSFIAVLKAETARPPAPNGARATAALSPLLCANTTRSGRTKRWTEQPPATLLRRRRPERCRAAAAGRRIPAIWKCGSSAVTGASRGAAARCLSRRAGRRIRRLRRSRRRPLDGALSPRSRSARYDERHRTLHPMPRSQ